jgi:hypothetical protein
MTMFVASLFAAFMLGTIVGAGLFVATLAGIAWLYNDDIPYRNKRIDRTEPIESTKPTKPAPTLVALTRIAG